MWPRLTLNDLRVIGHYLGTLILFMGALMLFPFIVALILGEYSPAGDFLVGIGVCLILGNLLRLLHVSPIRLTRRQALLIVGLSWFVLSCMAAIPMFLSDNYTSFPNALFDAVSNLTTTGFSMALDFEHMSYAHQLWRVIMVLLGGQGVIVVALSLGFFGRTSGVGSVYRGEGRTDHVLPNVVQSTRFIWIISGVMVILGTVVGTLISMGVGMDFWKALYNGFYLSVSSYDTGGITPHSSSLVYYHSLAIELYCAFFAVTGVINFGIYASLVSGRWSEFWHNMEARITVVWFAVSAVVMCIVLTGTGLFDSFSELFRRGTLMTLYAATTSGLQNIYSDQLQTAFTTSAMVILFIIMVVGGTSSSTAGGIKVVRLGILAKSIWLRIKQTLLPPSAIQYSEYHQFGPHSITNELASQTMIIFTLYVVTGLIGGMVGIVFGYDAIPALFESFACVSNNGISTGIISTTMPSFLKFFYAFEMYAGRLEFIALLATVAQLLVPLFSWIPSRRKMVHSS